MNTHDPIELALARLNPRPATLSLEQRVANELGVQGSSSRSAFSPGALAKLAAVLLVALGITAFVITRPAIDSRNASSPSGERAISVTSQLGASSSLVSAREVIPESLTDLGQRTYKLRYVDEVTVNAPDLGGIVRVQYPREERISIPVSYF
jgi:hypothetical protein